MTDFTSILGMKADEAERPRPLPQGTYQFMVVKAPEFGESKQKKTPYVEFTVRPISPLADVDPAELAQVPNWNQRELRHTFYLTQDSIYRLSEFLTHCGLNLSGRTYAQVIPEAQGQSFLGAVVHEPNQKDPTAAPYANIGSTAAVS